MPFITDLISKVTNLRIKIGDKLNILKSQIGQLNSLTTDDKTSLVGAVNEVNNIQIGGRNLIIGLSKHFETSNGWYYYSLSERLIEGESYYISGDINNPNGSVLAVGLNLNNGINNNLISLPLNQSFIATVQMSWLDKFCLAVQTENGIVKFSNFKLEKGNKATDWTPAPEDVDASILQSKTDSIAASKAYSDAQDELKRIQTEAYADGKITAAEQRAIDDATAKAEAAKIYAAAQDNLLRVQLEAYADGQITAEEQQRIQQMQDNLTAAKAYADAQANLAKIAALAYADGVVDEEEARAIADATAKMELAKQHAQGLVNNIQIGGRNLITGLSQHFETSNGWYYYSLSERLIEGESYYISGEISNPNGSMLAIGLNLNNGINYNYIPLPLNQSFIATVQMSWLDKFCLAVQTENGIVKFSNFKLEKGNKATDWTPAPEDVDNAINDVKIKAEQAISQLTSIANDNILSPSEKQQISNEWNRIKSEYVSNYSLGISNGVDTTNLTNAYNDLFNYINPLLVDISVESSIVGDVFRAKFKAYYDQNIAIIVAVNEKLRSGISANSGAINQLNSTLERINKVTSFLGTTVDNNVIATGVVLVGEGNEGTGGMSGIRDQGQESIFLYSGQTFNNRYSAPFRVTHGGSVVMTNAYVSGHVTATSGTFSGRIEAQTGYIGGLTLQDKLLTTTDVNSGIWFTYENDDYKSSIRMGNNIGTGILPNQNYYPFLMIQNQAKKVVSPWESYKAGIHLDMKSFNDNILSYPAIEVKNGHYQGLAFNVESYSSKSTISRDTDLCYASIASGMPSEVYLPDNPRQGKTLTIINPDPNIGSITVRSRNHSIASKWLHQDKSLSFNATMMLVFMGTSWITIVRT